MSEKNEPHVIPSVAVSSEAPTQRSPAGETLPASEALEPREPSNNKALMKMETSAPSRPVVVAGSLIATKAMRWSDTSSEDLLKEVMRRSTLERDLASQGEKHIQELRLWDKKHGRQKRVFWFCLLCISCGLLWLSLSKGWEFVDSERPYREFNRLLVKNPEVIFEEDARRTLTPEVWTETLADQWKRLSPEAKSSFVDDRKRLILWQACLATLFAVLSGILPAVVLWNLKDWWTGYSPWKGLLTAIFASVIGVGAFTLPWIIWVDYRNSMVGASAPLLAAAIHILHIRSALLKDGAFPKSHKQSRNQPSLVSQGSGDSETDERTRKLFEQLNPPSSSETK